jgi:hypothetical protein
MILALLMREAPHLVKANWDSLSSASEEIGRLVKSLALKMF